MTPFPFVLDLCQKPSQSYHACGNIQSWPNNQHEHIFYFWEGQRRGCLYAKNTVKIYPTCWKQTILTCKLFGCKWIPWAGIWHFPHWKPHTQIQLVFSFTTWKTPPPSDLSLSLISLSLSHTDADTHTHTTPTCLPCWLPKLRLWEGGQIVCFSQCQGSAAGMRPWEQLLPFLASSWWLHQVRATGSLTLDEQEAVYVYVCVRWSVSTGVSGDVLWSFLESRATLRRTNAVS